MALLRGVWNSDMVARFVLGVLCIEAFFLKDRGHALDVTVNCSDADRQWRERGMSHCGSIASFESDDSDTANRTVRYLQR